MTKDMSEGSVTRKRDIPDHRRTRIDRKFSYHPPKNDQPERYEYLRLQAKDLSLLIEKECPDSEEKETALQKLEECVFWANASIARNE